MGRSRFARPSPTALDEASINELAEQIGMLLNIEVTEELHTKLQQTLWQLDEKRLIEPATS